MHGSSTTDTAGAAGAVVSAGSAGTVGSEGSMTKAERPFRQCAQIQSAPPTPTIAQVNKMEIEIDMVGNPYRGRQTRCKAIR